MRTFRFKLASPAALVLLLGALAGCGDARPNVHESASPRPVTIGSRFDPATTGMITGSVRWQGDPPAVPALMIQVNPYGGPALRVRQQHPNPNAPAIDARMRSVGNAVVFLRGVDLQRSRPWDHPAVVVEQRARQLVIRQGDRAARIGLVRRGDAVEMISRDDVYHSLHAIGAAYFSLAFPDPNQPRKRALTERGVVELTSAVGYYWMRAYLFVDDHPYYCGTDAEGRFSLSQVPPGRYELVCWMANWGVARHERDPEASVITRLFFMPPVEQVRSVEVKPGEVQSLEFRISAEPFMQSTAR